MVPARLRVAVLYGGRSGEHEVSLASARSVIAAMDPNRYEIYPVGISKEGRWLPSERYLGDGDPVRMIAGEASARSSSDTTLAPRADQLARQLSRFPRVDVVFPVLHGTFGEDGTVQGLFELADLPYVGAGVLGSAVGMDKAVMKDVLSAHGLPVVESTTVLASRWATTPEAVIEEIEQRFAYPLFVKPCNLGSSVGVSKARDRRDLKAALDTAARYDRRLLIERAVNAREIECSVLGNDEPEASLPGEVVPSNEFYDYRAKYVDGDSQLVIPAPLDEATTERVRRLAVEAFRAIDGSGLARVDFFLCRDSGQLYVNELNTMPGFTNISMYPKLWEATGLTYSELVDRLIELALERHRQKQSLERSFDIPDGRATVEAGDVQT